MIEIHIIALIVLFLATINDIKSREVPDTLSFGLIIMGFGVNIIRSILILSLNPLIYSIIGFGIAFLIGFLMYKLGQWGGGDAKLLMGLGALIGISKLEFGFFTIFLVNTIMAGALYGLIWIFIIYLKNYKKIDLKIKMQKKLSKYKKLKICSIIISTLLILFALTSPFFQISHRIVFLLLSIIIFYLHHLIMAIKIIEEQYFIKQVTPDKLTEGDWIFKPVKIKNKIIASPKDLGVSLEQISLIKKHNIRKVWIKEGIPFVPSFFLGYLITLLFNNWFLLF